MDFDFKQLALAIQTIAEEKNLPEETVQEVVEQALAAAYRRDYGDREQEVRVTMNLNTGDVDAYISKEIVNEVENKQNQISLKEAQVMRKNATLGETIEVHHKVESFGRVAAQTAKQVIVQKLREAERESIVGEFTDKEETIVSGIVQRVERGTAFIDLGRTTAILPFEEQIPSERLRPGERIRTYLFSIEEGFRGLSIRLSRTHPKFLIELFKNESQEIATGIVEIVAVAREPGSRSKIAVKSNDERIDPIGACVGQRGVRVSAITDELSGEKIDVIEWSPDARRFIATALSPAKVLSIDLDETDRKAVVTVSKDEQSLAIGKGGQNVRLAAKLTGWKIDIVSGGEMIAEADVAGTFTAQGEIVDETIEEQAEEILSDLGVIEADAPKNAEVENEVAEDIVATEEQPIIDQAVALEEEVATEKVEENK